FFFFSSRRRHTRFSRDWSSDVCSSDLDARRTPVPEPRRDARSGTCGLGRAGLGRCANGARRAPAHRRARLGWRPGGFLVSLRTVRNGRFVSAGADRPGGGEPGVRGTVRARLPDLRHRPHRHRDAGGGADPDRQRRGDRAGHRARGATKDRRASGSQAARWPRRRAPGRYDMTLSTHVLDTGIGEPASGVPVRLEVQDGGAWVAVASGTTDADGRLRDWVPPERWHAGTYRLIFDTAARS